MREGEDTHTHTDKQMDRQTRPSSSSFPSSSPAIQERPRRQAKTALSSSFPPPSLSPPILPLTVGGGRGLLSKHLLGVVETETKEQTKKEPQGRSDSHSPFPLTLTPAAPLLRIIIRIIIIIILRYDRERQ